MLNCAFYTQSRGLCGRSDGAICDTPRTECHPKHPWPEQSQSPLAWEALEARAKKELQEDPTTYGSTAAVWRPLLEPPLPEEGSLAQAEALASLLFSSQCSPRRARVCHQHRFESCFCQWKPQEPRETTHTQLGAKCTANTAFCDRIFDDQLDRDHIEHPPQMQHHSIHLQHQSQPFLFSFRPHLAPRAHMHSRQCGNKHTLQLHHIQFHGEHIDRKSRAAWLVPHASYRVFFPWPCSVPVAHFAHAPIALKRRTLGHLHQSIAVASPTTLHRAHVTRDIVCVSPGPFRSISCWAPSGLPPRATQSAHQTRMVNRHWDREELRKIFFQPSNKRMKEENTPLK